MNDSETHYVSNMFLYQRKDEKRPANLTATEYPVYRLLNEKEYIEVGHATFVDNWYNSKNICVKVKLDLGNHIAGTCKVNRSGLYKPGIFPKKGAGVKERGAYECYSIKMPGSGEKLYMICWMDSKPVHMLSTIPSKLSTCNRNTKDPQGRYQKLSLPQPTAIKLYNRGMGGTDGINAKIEAYRTSVRTKPWPPRILFHMIQLAQVNAHILFKGVFKPDRKANSLFTLLDFSLALVDELILDHMRNKKTSEPSANNSDEDSEDHDGEEAGFDQNQVLAAMPKQKGKWITANRVANHPGRLTGRHFARLASSEVGRKRCRWCKIKTTWFCTNPLCSNMYFCMQTNADLQMSCFEYWHTCTDRLFQSDPEFG